MTQRWGSVHGLLHRIGVDIVRHPGTTTTLGRRLGHFQRWAIDRVIDVGANSGQYGQAIRSMGYRGSIISIEPLPEAYRVLAQRAATDRDWRVMRLALGTSDSRAVLYVAGNSYSSSLYPLTATHQRAAPDAAAVREIEVDVRRLDGLGEDLIGTSIRPLLKLDTQGSELDILQGAGSTVGRFAGVHVELSLAEMYAGAPGMRDVNDWLEAQGFVLAEIEPEFSDPATGRLLQVNGLYFNSAIVTPTVGSGSVP